MQPRATQSLSPSETLRIQDFLGKRIRQDGPSIKPPCLMKSGIENCYLFFGMFTFTEPVLLFIVLVCVS